MKSVLNSLAIVSLMMLVSVVALAAPVALGSFETVENNNLVAEEIEVTLYGGGTMENPYVISTYSEFNSYSNLIIENNSVYGSAYYKLGSNIDFGNNAMVPMGTETAPFRGTLDGNGYSIINACPVNVESCGIIGFMSGGTVKNLEVRYRDMTSEMNTSTLRFFGGIVGRIEVAADSMVIVENCVSHGKILINDSSTLHISGIIGKLETKSGNAVVLNCLSYLDFDVTSASTVYAGGICAFAKNSSSKSFSISNCVSYSDFDIYVKSIEANVGALAGYAEIDVSGWSDWGADDETVYYFENCVAAGNINCETPKSIYAGRFLGKKLGEGKLNIKNCYNASSQIFNLNGKKVTIYDKQPDITSENLASKAYFADVLKYDFDNIWYMNELSKELGIRPVAKSKGGPVSKTNAVDLRLDDKSGIRYTASVELEKRDYAFEYGFIIGLKNELESNEDLTFEHTGRIAYKAAFSTEEDIDVIFNLDEFEKTVTFKGVLINIPESNYGTVVVSRPYLKYVSNGKTEILYGEPIEASVNSVADKIVESPVYKTLSDTQKEQLSKMTTK